MLVALFKFTFSDEAPASATVITEYLRHFRSGLGSLRMVVALPVTSWRMECASDVPKQLNLEREY